MQWIGAERPLATQSRCMSLALETGDIDAVNELLSKNATSPFSESARIGIITKMVPCRAQQPMTRAGRYVAQGRRQRAYVRQSLLQLAEPNIHSTPCDGDPWNAWERRTHRA